jgi:hypothetical protein
MGRLPAYGRELLTMRRFGNRRPPLGAVFVTDWWDAARMLREKLNYFALVVEPFIQPDLTACHGLEVIVVMKGNSSLVLKALRRARPCRLAVCSPEQFLDWVEGIAKLRSARTVTA